MAMKLPLFLIALFSATAVSAASSDSPMAVAQSLFDGMKAHDAKALSALFVPGAILASVDSEGKVTISPVDKWVERIASSKSLLVERMLSPKTLEHGVIAQVWTDYDFHSDGTLTHCGIDSFSLLKTADGWKIAAITYNRETSGCAADMKQ